jgi:hypothetical protein
VRFVIRDNLERSRLTTFFRFFLALPHIIWLSMWGGIMVLLLPIQWVATLIKRRPIEGLHEVYEMYVRYTLHVYAYLFLAADPFPRNFLGKPGRYPIDVEPIPCDEQSRRSVGFRLFLALPPLILASALGSGIVTSAGSAVSIGVGPAVIVAFLAWFAILVKGRMPPGMRDVVTYALTYATQVGAYFFLVTGRFPDSNLRTVPMLPRPPHPVSMRNEDAPERNRLTVFFRLILVLPHAVWLLLWGLVVFLAAIVAWIIGIFMGRIPAGLHRFFAAYIRYDAHVTAFGSLAGGPFPGFTGKAGSYPVDIEIAPPEKQSRWSIGFRWLLGFPAFMILGGLGTAQSVAAVGAWFYALVRGRMPSGLHSLLAYIVRYTGQTYAYALLLTPVYPHSGPSEEIAVEREPEPPSLDSAPEAVFATATSETTAPRTEGV